MGKDVADSSLLDCWAASPVAQKFDSADPFKRNLGWAVGEKPDARTANSRAFEIDSKINYLLHYSGAEWCATSPYVFNAMVRKDMVLYRLYDAHSLNDPPPNLHWRPIMNLVTGSPILQACALADLPPAGQHPAEIIRVTDGAGGKPIVVSDGVTWRYFDGVAV